METVCITTTLEQVHNWNFAVEIILLIVYVTLCLYLLAPIAAQDIINIVTHSHDNIEYYLYEPLQTVPQDTAAWDIHTIQYCHAPGSEDIHTITIIWTQNIIFLQSILCNCQIIQKYICNIKGLL